MKFADKYKKMNRSDKALLFLGLFLMMSILGVGCVTVFEGEEKSYIQQEDLEKEVENSIKEEDYRPFDSYPDFDYL